MQADELRAIQTPIKERYKTEPAAALVQMSVTGVLYPERIVCRLDPAPSREAGLHPAAGGPEGLACSGDLLLESLVACAGVTLCAVATAMEIPITAGRVIGSGDLDFRGTLGVDRETPIGMQNLSLRFELETDAEDAKIQKLLQLTERYCVIYRTLAPSTPIETTVTYTNRPA
jgi:uncharacterized OsmC-like protein